MEEKIDKIYKLVIVCIVLISIVLVMNIFGGFKIKSGDDSSNNTSSSTQNQTQNSSYDVSMMKSLSLNDLVKLFDDTKNDYVVYLGRSTCSACVSFLPTLQNAQEKHKYTTQYLDITTVDSKSDTFEKLMDKLSKQVTLTVNGETKTQSFGDFYGYTPMTFIIKKGKFVDGIVGAYSESKFDDFLSKNGIK